MPVARTRIASSRISLRMHMPRNRRKRHLADAGAVLLFDWVQTLPPFAQPIANGALVVVFVVLVRGLIVLPLFMLYLLFVSHAPLAELTLAAVSYTHLTLPTNREV